MQKPESQWRPRLRVHIFFWKGALQLTSTSVSEGVGVRVVGSGKPDHYLGPLLKGGRGLEGKKMVSPPGNRQTRDDRPVSIINRTFWGSDALLAMNY